MGPLNSLMITPETIEELRTYLESGRWEEDFDCRTPDGQGEMLDMLEALFGLCETADEILTRKLYRNMRGQGPSSSGDGPAVSGGPGS